MTPAAPIAIATQAQAFRMEYRGRRSGTSAGRKKMKVSLFRVATSAQATSSRTFPRKANNTAKLMPRSSTVS